MSKKGVVRLGVVALVLLVLCYSAVIGQDMTGKLSRVIRVELELSSDVYRVIETEYRGQRLILIAIFGNNKALNSSLGQDIKAGLKENMSETPLAISVLSRDKEVKFHPYALRVIQGDEETSPKDVIGITEDFKNGAMPERVPIDNEVFWGGKGIITLGADFDTSTSFNVKYGTSSAHFSLPSQETEMDTVMEGKGESGKEESPGESIEDTDTDTSPNESEGLSGTDSSSSPPPSGNNPGTGGGFIALLAQLGALLLITASFL